MCGIFGVFALPKDLPSDNAAGDALACLAHRGPDASGQYRMDDEGLLLGHTRLSILDPRARSDQPFVREKTVLTFNGEIYNFRLLRRELEELGATFATDGDTEVIAVGYEYWGIAVFAKLHGMFALAIFDRAENSLHLSRDRFGIKPLVYMQSDSGFYFASEIKPIAKFNRFELDPEILSDILTWGFQTENRSLFRGVEYLDPGAVMTLRLSPYGPEVVARRIVSDFNEVTTGLDLYNVVDASVEDHMISDVPVALALSGGLDSSIVAACAARHSDRLDAFTYTFNSEIDAEVAHASLICEEKKLTHHVQTHQSLPDNLLTEIAYYLEEPIGNVNVVPSLLLARSLQEAGYKVALVGEGADEIFGGYPWHLFARGDAGLSGAEIFDAYRKRRAQKGCFRYLTSDFAKQVEARAARQRTAFADDLDKAASPFQGFMAYDRATQLQFSQLLRVDRMFMAHGVEARVPFLYSSVLTKSLDLTEDELATTEPIEGRTSKIALARAFAGELPKAILTRPKFGAGGTINLWETSLAEAVGNAFKSLSDGGRFTEARVLLAPYIDWERALSVKLALKEQFALLILLETVQLFLVEGPAYASQALAKESK